MAVSMKNLDPVFQGAGQKAYPHVNVAFPPKSVFSSTKVLIFIYAIFCNTTVSLS